MHIHGILFEHTINSPKKIISLGFVRDEGCNLSFHYMYIPVPINKKEFGQPMR